MVPVVGLERLPDRFREERRPEHEVDVGARRFDPDIAEFGVCRDPFGDLGGNLPGWALLALCQFKRYGRGEIGVISPGCEEDVLLTGACPEHALNLVVFFLKHQYPVL